MKKYKLINKQTGEEHICEKVTIDSFDYYVINTEIGCKYGVSMLNELCKYGISMLNEVIEIKNDFDSTLFKGIVCTNNPNIDIKQVLNETGKFSIDVTINGEIDKEAKFIAETCFMAGYNKHKENHPFSREDVCDIIAFIATTPKTRGMFNGDIVRLWEIQKPKTLYYE